MSTEAERRAEEARRNLQRRDAWRQRWLEKFPMAYAHGFTTPTVVRKFVMTHVSLNSDGSIGLGGYIDAQ